MAEGEVLRSMLCSERIPSVDRCKFPLSNLNEQLSFYLLPTILFSCTILGTDLFLLHANKFCSVSDFIDETVA